VRLSQDQANKILIGLGCLAFFGPMICWPITSLTVWRKSYQGILALSWIAIILSGAVLLLQAITKRDVESSSD
jgi:hypothetical protein